jgi:hypothetical protein
MVWSTNYKSFILNGLNGQPTLLIEPPVVGDPIVQRSPEYWRRTVVLSAPTQGASNEQESASGPIVHRQFF